MKQWTVVGWGLALLAAWPQCILADDSPVQADVVVYEGTPAGVMAAVAAARHGHSVALVELHRHLGGVVSGGLVATDIGDRKTVGGLADEFFGRIATHYREKYGEDSLQFRACRGGIIFEPHVAELVFDQMVAEQKTITVYKNVRYHSAATEGNRVVSLIAEDLEHHTARTFTGGVFIDASYEGDLMAGAHVPCRVGRESRAEYGEYLAGVSMGPGEQRGMGDHRTMAYNYRVSVTLDPERRVLFPKPEHYDPSPFINTDGKRIKEGRATGFGSFFTTIDKAGPNKTFDANWCDFVGNSEGYAEGDWTTRERIAAREKNFFLSRLWYFQNDPDLPEAFRNEARTWGLPKEEFADSGHFPFQLYVREARRMVGRYVLRENDLTQDRWKPDGIATGSYGVDCHVVQLLREGDHLVPEHTRHVANNNYDIPYRSLVPPDVENLMVPVCCSATHVAYCSLRMEPVYMMLGQASGDAAHLMLAGKTSAQRVNTNELRKLLLDEKAVLDAGWQPQVKIFHTPEHPAAGEKVVFKVVETTRRDPLATIRWDFDGTGFVGDSSERAVHAFDSEKVYTVSLLVTDNTGRKRLLTEEIPVGRALARDVTMDDFDAELFGRWDGTYPDNLPVEGLRMSDVYLGPGIQRDVIRQGKKSPARARFQPEIPRSGRYVVCLGFRPSRRQATNVPVTIHSADGVKKVVADERTETTPFNFTPIGEFRFKAGRSGFVELTNGNTDGYVVIDGVRWVWLGD